MQGKGGKTLFNRFHSSFVRNRKEEEKKGKKTGKRERGKKGLSMAQRDTK